MDANRFDALSKALSERRSRRTTLKKGIVGLGAALLGTGSVHACRAQDATPVATPEHSVVEPEFLFVQTATSGTFTPNPGAGTPSVDSAPTPGGGADYLLTLEGHPGGTVYFSDPPERLFGEAPTQAFLDGLGFSPENPPNAALVTQTPDGTDDVVVLELMNPSYDEPTRTVT